MLPSFIRAPLDIIGLSTFLESSLNSYKSDNRAEQEREYTQYAQNLESKEKQDKKSDKNYVIKSPKNSN